MQVWYLCDPAMAVLVTWAQEEGGIKNGWMEEGMDGLLFEQLSNRENPNVSKDFVLYFAPLVSDVK